jgi:hypothetical protein
MDQHFKQIDPKAKQNPQLMKMMMLIAGKKN